MGYLPVLENGSQAFSKVVTTSQSIKVQIAL